MKRANVYHFNIPYKDYINYIKYIKIYTYCQDKIFILLLELRALVNM